MNAMKRFVFDEAPEFHQNVLKPKPDGPKPMNLGLVLSESLRFSTDPEPGRELVDILTNATRRALRATFNPKDGGKFQNYYNAYVSNVR
jgi:hypothetical protein